MTALPAELGKYLRILRDAFATQAQQAGQDLIYHALIALRDDLGVEVAKKANEYFLPSADEKHRFQGPEGSTGQVLAFEMMSVLQPPIWTPQGAKLRLPALTWGMLPDARQQLIAEPGIVATAVFFAEAVLPDVLNAYEQFERLASDAFECVERLWRLCPLPVPYDAGTMGDDPPFNWMRFLYRLIAREDRRSREVPYLVRHTWVEDTAGQPVYLPYDRPELARAIAEGGGARRVAAQTSDPPDRFVAVFQQDVFSASCNAIDELLGLVQSGSDDMAERPAETAVTSATAASRRDYVFISYAHADRNWVDEFTTMLAPALRDKTVKVWHDKKIRPGTEWRADIDDALSRAAVGVLLVTKNFFASDFIVDEELDYLLAKARENQVGLLWICVGDCMWKQTPLAKIQSLGNPGVPLNKTRGANRDTKVRELCERIAEEYQERLSPPSL